MTVAAAKSLEQVIGQLRKLSPEVPSHAVVLGSGVKVLEDLAGTQSISFEELFGIAPGVVGHSGSLSLGAVNGKLIAVLRGRFHLYEGHDWNVVTLPTRVLVEWGVPKLFLTNAAGGLNETFQVGDLMLLTGYRDMLSPNLEKTGLLPALKMQPVDCRNEITELLQKASDDLSKKDVSFHPLRHGTYAGLLGPTYETMAEVAMLRKLKADAVGMSTVPELLAAKGTSTKAAAISVITNIWNPDVPIGGHEEVLAAAKEASTRLDKLFRSVV